MLADFPKCCEALDGKLLQVHISVDTVYIDNSRSIREDIMCENGIIHAVDTVIGADLEFARCIKPAPPQVPLESDLSPENAASFGRVS